MKKILLINLPFEKVYKKTKIAKVTHCAPPLSLATIGASLLEDKHDVKIFDFNLPENDLKKFKLVLERFEPGFVGITFVTPLFNEMCKVVRLIKKMDMKILIIGGGPHCSSYPKRTLEESNLDIVVIGEGDFIIKNIVNGKPLKKIKSIAYRVRGGKKRIVINKRANPIKDLNELPLPAYKLYDIKKYNLPKIVARESPVAWMETSRGCVHNCSYCNKSVFGRCFRTKSPERVVNEMIRIKNMGFKEVHFTDDAFTTNINRAKKICDLLIERKVGLGWALVTGVRVDQVDYELLCKMKEAGCYKLFFGIESGNQDILDNIGKRITLGQVRKAVYWAKKAGIIVWGAFMIGLPGETEESMEDTINFAKELPLDLAKMSMLIPLPATPLFEEWDRGGHIKTKEWEKFSFYTIPKEIYDHPTISWKKITKYYNKFYREFYFRPSFIWRMLKNSIQKGMLVEHIRILLGTKWFQK